MSTILLFDAAATGHHGEFLENVIHGLSVAESERSIILAHPELKQRLSSFRDSIGSKIQLIFLKVEEVNYLEHARGIVQVGRRQLEVLSRYLQELSVSRVVLMHMNLHQYALHSWRVPEGVEVVGILLNPYTPRDRAHGLKAKCFAAVTGIRKRLQFRLLLRNKAISKIFLLNDARMAEQLNRWHPKRQVFASIPDPLPALCPVLDQGAFDSSERPFTFLLAGSMAPRKGVLEVLEALICLRGQLDRPIALRMVGRFRREAEAYREQVLSKIRELEQGEAGSLIRVHLENVFIDSESLSREFAETDCVLTPYLEFYGSSGMIGHACRYQKPLLSCLDGLLGELVRDRKLGVCVDPRHAEQFAAAMQRIIGGEHDYDSEAADRYVAAADPMKFVQLLIA
jgi:glycosyltransferase involved in cell wall biosynthesis